MSMLDSVTTGKIKKPHLILLYGPDGSGKSTFASDAPKPIFLGKEDGTNFLDVARFPEPKSFGDILLAIDELINEKHSYETLAIDSLDWIEPLVWQHVCNTAGKQSIEDVGGGYGKGYTEANRHWLHMMGKLQELRSKRRMNIIAIAHSQIKIFNDPSQPAPYDRYQLKLNEKAAALWRELVDFVGFATYEVFTKADKGAQKSKAFGDGKRVLYTERRPSFDAKNRLGLPFELALSFSEFQKAADKHEPRPVDDILANIHELSALLTDEEIKKKVAASVEKAGSNVLALEKILNKLRTITTT